MRTPARLLVLDRAPVAPIAPPSVGVATLPDVAASAEELVRAADMAMYQVKDSGKNGVRIAQPE